MMQGRIILPNDSAHLTEKINDKRGLKEIRSTSLR